MLALPLWLRVPRAQTHPVVMSSLSLVDREIFQDADGPISRWKRQYVFNPVTTRSKVQAWSQRREDKERGREVAGAGAHRSRRGRHPLERSLEDSTHCGPEAVGWSLCGATGHGCACLNHPSLLPTRGAVLTLPATIILHFHTHALGGFPPHGVLGQMGPFTPFRAVGPGSS